MWSMIMTMSGRTTPGNGILTPVVQRLKMLIKYDQSELEAAILNAVLEPTLPLL